MIVGVVEFFDVLMDVLRCVGVSNVGRICSLEKEWTEDMGPSPRGRGDCATNIRVS